MDRRLLLVTGAGRSGTSTVAGTLYHLGVHVPGPYLRANASNPRGFYEARWSVDFHNRLLKRAHVSIADGRPEAVDILQGAIEPEDEAALGTWVDEVTTGHPTTLVKDPRTAWTLPLWTKVAEDLRITLGHLVMLRHPAEVVGSRATHYAAGLEKLGVTGYATRNLAGWVNAMLMTEAGTRPSDRTFVFYNDLLSDWRAAVTKAADDLHLELGADLAHRDGHPVDDFIDPQLSRHPLTWSDVEVPRDLREVATDVWDACETLAKSGGHDPEAERSLDKARTRYAELYQAAQHLAHDSTEASVAAARREARRAGRREGRRQTTGANPRIDADRSTPRRVAGAMRNGLRTIIRR